MASFINHHQRCLAEKATVEDSRLGSKEARKNLVCVCRRDGKLQPKRLHHADDGAKFRIALGAQGFIEAFTGQPGFPGDLRHTPSASDGSKRLRNKGWIVGFQRFFHVGIDGFGAVQIFSRIIGRGFYFLFCQGSIPQVGRKRSCRLDVFGLRALIAATQQDD